MDASGLTLIVAACLWILALAAIARLWGKYIHVSVSCVLAGPGLAAVFVYIPVVSDYAFWFFLLSYIMLDSNYRYLALNHLHVSPNLNPGVIVSRILAVLAIVAVFIYIPFVSDYAFWFLVLGYIALGLGYLIAWLDAPPAPVLTAPVPPPSANALDGLWYLQVEAEVRGPTQGTPSNR